MSAAKQGQRLLGDFDGVETPQTRETVSATLREPSPEAPGASLWNEAVERFLSWKCAETNIGEGWIRRMRWELLRFPSLLGRVGITDGPRMPGGVTGEMVGLLRTGLPWEKSTFALHFAALRQFLSWAGNPTAARKSIWSLPSGEPTHRRWLTKEQFQRLYRASTGFARLLVALEGLNGLRRVEVLRLRTKDVSLDEGCLRVLGKGRNGGKWRKIPMFPGCEHVLRTMIKDRQPGDRLLPLSRSGADLLLARTAVAAGLRAEGVRVSHHDLRRTFGRLAHKAGMDLIQLKNLFGHTSVEMTVRYIGLDSDTMRAGLGKLSAALGSLD